MVRVLSAQSWRRLPLCAVLRSTLAKIVKLGATAVYRFLLFQVWDESTVHAAGL